MVKPNGDQVLAAEPVFHREPPRGSVVAMAMVVRHRSDCLPEVAEQQTENGFALRLVSAEAQGLVVEDGAGGAAMEAVTRLMIEFVGGEFHEEGQGFVGAGC